MTTIPVLDPVTDINDSDLVMVTNAQGLSYTINGAELEKRNKIIMAENITVTGAPLKAGRCVRIYFSADITANDGNSVMQINYNNVNYYVKVPKDGALSNFVAHAVGNTYKYVQAHTTLEFLVVGNQQDGFQFVIIGNPVVISNSDYSIQADGSITYTRSGVFKTTVGRYRANTGNSVLRNLCNNFNIPPFSWVTFTLTGFDMNSLSDNYQYNGIFYYESDANIVSVTLIKINGTASILGTNNQGSMLSTFDSGAPSLNFEVISVF